MQSIRKDYVDNQRRKRLNPDENDPPTLPQKKRGRPFLLGRELDDKVQAYLVKVREAGGAVSARIAVATARGVLLTYDKTRLEEFGGSIRLGKSWAHSLLQRMNFVQRKATTAKSKQSDADFAMLKKSFLEDVFTTVTMEDVPPELILNWDQTGIKLVPSSNWTMAPKGSGRVEMTGVTDKRQITAVFCGTLVGDFLPVQLIYKGKTQRCHPCYDFPPGWSITQSPKHWSTEDTMLEYIRDIIIPYVERVREELGERKSALVVIDNFKGQVTPAVNAALDECDIHVVLLPPNTTDRLQPLDISVNKPAKDFIRGKFQEWYSNKVMQQLSELDDEVVSGNGRTLRSPSRNHRQWLYSIRNSRSFGKS